MASTCHHIWTVNNFLTNRHIFIQEVWTYFIESFSKRLGTCSQTYFPLSLTSQHSILTRNQSKPFRCYVDLKIVLFYVDIFSDKSTYFDKRICCNQVVMYRIWTCHVMSPCQKILYQLDGTNWTLELICAKYLYMSNQWRNLTVVI